MSSMWLDQLTARLVDVVFAGDHRGALLLRCDRPHEHLVRVGVRVWLRVRVRVGVRGRVEVGIGVGVAVGVRVRVRGGRVRVRIHMSTRAASRSDRACSTMHWLRAMAMPPETEIIRRKRTKRGACSCPAILTKLRTWSKKCSHRKCSPAITWGTASMTCGSSLITSRLFVNLGTDGAVVEVDCVDAAGGRDVVGHQVRLCVADEELDVIDLSESAEWATLA